MRKVIKEFTIFLLGGMSYFMLEIATRGRSHWTMALTGGACVYSMYKISSKLPHWSWWKKCLLAAVTITLIEFNVGCIVNLWFDMKVWNYKDRAFNIMGQICLLFSLFWFLLSIPVIKLFDRITHK